MPRANLVDGMRWLQSTAAWQLRVSTGIAKSTAQGKRI
jgi:hypothetical protein